MKYFIFFSLLSAYTLHLFGNTDSYWSCLLIWLFISFSVLALAYFLNIPFLVLGKTSAGTYSFLIICLNLPWLMFTWAVWYIIMKLSKEDLLNQIGNTNVFISRYPLSKEIQDQYDLVVDLTAEFPPSATNGQNYTYLPCLDGIAPTDIQFPQHITRQSKILVHCAQGHGRSATYTVFLLKKLGYVDSINESYSLIKQSRPQAKVSKEQFYYIQHHC